METNPYARQLGEQDARAVMAATPGLLTQAAGGLTFEQAELPIAEGKWCVRQIAAHMADCELAFSFRLRQTLAEDSPVLQPFDQDAWARHDASYQLKEALELFRAAREWNVRLIGGLSAAEWERPATHPRLGALSFRKQIEMMAGHDLNHLAQVQAFAANHVKV